MPKPVQLDVIFDQQSLVDAGLASGYNGIGTPGVISGVALNTFGLLWGSQDIWIPDSQYIGINTVWTVEYLPS